MNKLILYAIIVVLCFGSRTISAQNPAYFKIGETAFANTDIYTLLFDEQTDILYIGTNNGLYAHRQNAFIPLNGPKDQIGHSLFALKKNNKGEIFCHNLNGQLFKLQGNSFVLHYQLPKDVPLTYFSYYFTAEDDIILSSSIHVLLLSPDGVVLKEILNSKKHPKFPDGNSISSLSQTTDGKVYITFHRKNTVFTYQNNHLDSIEVDFKNIEAYSTFFKFNDNIFSICKGGNINSAASHIYQGFTPNNKEQVNQFSEEELIGINQKKGVHFLKLRNDTLYESQHFFDNLFISTFYKKENGTLFFGTFGEGIIIIPDKNNIAPTFEHLFIGITAFSNNEVFLSTRSGKIFRYKNELELIDEQNFNIDNIFSIYGDFSFQEIKQKGVIYPTKTDLNYALKDIAQIDSFHLLEATPNGVHIRANKITLRLKDLAFLAVTKDSLRYTIFSGKRSYAVCWSPKDSTIYHSTGFGVYRKKWSSPERDILSFNNHPFMGNDLEFHKDLLICGTGKEGLLFFKNNQFSFQLSKKDGLYSNSVKKIKVKDDKLYILTKKGIQVYDFNQKNFIQLGIKDGVFDTGITNFALSKDKIWLLEKHRFYSLNLSTLGKEEKLGQLYIDSLTINNDKIDYTSNHAFSYHENAFKLYFDYRDIETKSSTDILYQLKGFTDSWKSLPSTQNLIEFQYLPPGQYTFELKAVHKTQETKPFTYSFQIYAPFWRRWWFFISLALLMATITYLTNKRRANKLKKASLIQLEKEKLKTNILDAELKALRSQMNPHFIFNSLNSIQDLILKEDTDASYDYIVLFADLVRSTLNYSNQDFIPFEKEIEFLNVYLTLEKLRFEEDFTYAINYKGDMNIKVPSLIVQPFIENALQHGLLHKKGKKTLTLNFELTDQLTCTIIDNGIGRIAAEKIQRRQGGKHESFALKAIEKRLSILNAKNNFQAGYIVHDLYSDDKATGTKVIVTIPYKMQY